MVQIKRSLVAMKKSLIFGITLTLAGVAQAQAIDGQDASVKDLAEASQVAFDTVKQSGAYGLIEAISQCYAIRLKQGHQDFECVWLDLAGHRIDYKTSSALRVAPKDFWNGPIMADRMKPAFKAAHFDGDASVKYLITVTPVINADVDRLLGVEPTVGLALNAPEKAGNNTCLAQKLAFEKAYSIYQKDHSKSRTFFRSFFQDGSNSTLSLHDAQMKNATDALASCRRAEKNAQRIASENAKREAYNAQPEVQAQRIAIEKANAAYNGFVNVATFTSIGWLRSFGLTPWTPIGETDSQTFFYTFISRDYRTFVSIKTATKGAGKNYIRLDFLSGQLDCRPGAGYPEAIAIPSLDSYRGNGYPIVDDDVEPTNVSIPIVHGTVLASAVIGTCDAVRRSNGTANVTNTPIRIQ